MISTNLQGVTLGIGLHKLGSMVYLASHSFDAERCNLFFFFSTGPYVIYRSCLYMCIAFTSRANMGGPSGQPFLRS